MAYFYLGMAYEGKGMHEEAIKTYQHGAELSGGYPGMALLKHRSQRHLFRLLA